MSEDAYKLARRRILNNALRRQQRSLDLSRKDLLALPPEIGQLVELQSLNLSGNKLTSLPLEIGQLVVLQVANAVRGEQSAD
jgi:Leucine-rich repeat (LRR) protein